jgi:hypothetical protein
VPALVLVLVPALVLSWAAVSGLDAAHAQAPDGNPHGPPRYEDGEWIRNGNDLTSFEVKGGHVTLIRINDIARPSP